jgi:RNA polymerase sigma factor (TIGR02999 family)
MPIDGAWERAMTSPPQQDVTRLLDLLSSGDQAVLDVLFPLVYGELRLLARRQLSRERPGHTLDSVALVNEAYLKLVDQGTLRWQNRAHFFAISARAMRAILVDHARARNAAKRGGGGVVVPLDEVAELLSDEEAERVEQLDEALTQLAKVNDEASRVVECLYFGGLTLEETATALGLSVATVRRRWSFAKAWLGRALEGVEQ